MNWLHFSLGIVLTALQAAIKDPNTVSKEFAILDEIRDLIDIVHPRQPNK